MHKPIHTNPLHSREHIYAYLSTLFTHGHQVNFESNNAAEVPALHVWFDHCNDRQILKKEDTGIQKAASREESI